ncbi:MAG: antibiotic biosynthesis monooxygenase [Actinomycetota bacterium]|nr:antibiotic biosynthesis monooxygenase [Actinomycetota bacterium]
MAKVAVVAKIMAQDGRRDEVLAVLRRIVEAADEEPGTEVYAVNTQDDEPNVIWIYELYADQAARESHGASETMKQVGAAVRELAAAPAQILALSPVSAVGLTL